MTVVSPRATASPTTSSRRRVACLHGDQAHRRGVAAVEARGARSPPTASAFRRSMRPSRRLQSDAASAAGGNPTICCFRRTVGLHLGARDAVVGRDDHLAGAQDQLPADDDLRGLQRRERVAGGPAQARHGAAGGWADACVRATACCSRGTPSRWHRGRTSAGWRRCGAACVPVRLRA